MKKYRLLALIVVAVVLAAVASGYWVTKPDTLLHPEMGFTEAHAVLAAGSGCADCHVDPIPYSGCSDCHPSPSRYITELNIYFEHHVESGGCKDCHAGAANDARFVTVPTADHSFCNTCHDSGHSTP